MSTARITHIGGLTALIEAEGWRLLTDHHGVRQVAKRLKVGLALLHLGAVRFPISGPARYTMTARDAVELCGLIRPQVAIPIQYDGWSHFKEGRDEIEREISSASADIREHWQWLPIGVSTEITS